MIEKYPENKKELDILLNEYNKIEEQQLEYILTDGTKLNLYQTIEDVMYGMYFKLCFLSQCFSSVLKLNFIL